MLISRTEAKNRILEKLAEGETIARSAELVGIHRNTVHYWLRTDPNFLAEVEAVNHTQALRAHIGLHQHINPAHNALYDIFHGENIPPAVRLRAALALLKAVTSPLEKAKNAQNVHKRRLNTAENPAAELEIEEIELLPVIDPSEADQ